MRTPIRFDWQVRSDVSAFVALKVEILTKFSDEAGAEMAPKKDSANKKRKGKNGTSTTNAHVSSDVWLLSLDECMSRKKVGHNLAHAVYSSKEKAIDGLADFLEEHLFWTGADECKKCLPGYENDKDDYSDDCIYEYHGDSIGDSGILLDKQIDGGDPLTVHLKRLEIDPVRRTEWSQTVIQRGDLLASR